MKFYDCTSAPNPRRTRIFLAEKGIEVPTVQIDLRNGQQFSPEYRAINPQCVVPFLVLDDGTGIGEAEAICRYFEEIHPTPPLFGTDAKDKAIVAMWQLRMTFEGFYAVGETFRNRTSAFKDRALSGPHPFEQIPALVERGQARIKIFFKTLDQRLGESEFIAGPRFTIADITAFVAIGFAGWMKLGIPDDHANLQRWHEAVSARPSAKA
jgi:glutathione S-transferase